MWLYHINVLFHATIVAPMYSAFVLNKATVGYFLLLQLMVALPRENINPLVNLLLEILLAWSTFVYP